MNTPTKIALVGTGNIGSVVARLSANAGLEVYISNSRGPASLADLASELGPNVHAASVEDAVDASELAIVSIPFGRFPDLPAAHFDNRTVIDTTNYIPFRDGSVASRLNGLRTPEELLSQHLQGARIVKGFSNIYSGHLLDLARPSGAADRSALPIAGDDEFAKAEVTAFLDTIGWDAVDTGNLSTSALFEVGSPVFVKAYMTDPSGTGDEWGARMTTDPGRPLPAAAVRTLVHGG